MGQRGRDRRGLGGGKVGVSREMRISLKRREDGKGVRAKVLALLMSVKKFSLCPIEQTSADDPILPEQYVVIHLTHAVIAQNLKHHKSSS